MTGYGPFAMSRCGTLALPFYTKGFKESRATPGIINDCKNIDFDIQSHTNSIINPLSISTTSYLEEDVEMCISAPINEVLIEDISVVNMEHELMEIEGAYYEHSCPIISDMSNSVSTTDVLIDEKLSRKQNIAFQVDVD